jgi:predicted GNAT family acetyltransferase
MSGEQEQLTVRDNVAEQQYEVHLRGQVAVLQYKRMEGRIILIHTEVPPALEGHGIAGMLARTALEAARADGLEVVPRCSYVAAYIRRHREILPLLSSAEQERLLAEE